MLFDLPLDELVQYRPKPDEPDDFDTYRQQTLDKHVSFLLGLELTPFDVGLRLMDIFDLTFQKIIRYCKVHRDKTEVNERFA